MEIQNNFQEKINNNTTQDQSIIIQNSNPYKKWLILAIVGIVVFFIFLKIPFCYENNARIETASLEGAFVDVSGYPEASKEKENFFSIEATEKYKAAASVCAIPDGGFSKTIDFSISIFEDKQKTKLLAYFDKEMLGLRRLVMAYSFGKNSAITIFPYSDTEYEIIVLASALDQKNPTYNPVYLNVDKSSKLITLISPENSKYIANKKAFDKKIKDQGCLMYGTCSNQDIKNTNNISTKTYKNIEAGYSINYPTSWHPPIVNESTKKDFNFNIQNISNAYTMGNMEAILNDNASYFNISVSSSLDGISYANYDTIDNFIKNSGIVTSAGVQSRLSLINSMNIGGQNLRVFNVKSDTSEKYEFIYNKKHYTINFTSGSYEQYLKDSSMFSALLSSFTLL